jgi:hypothetical protein
LWGAAIASTTRKTGVFVCLSGDMIAVCLEMGNFRPVAVHSPREEERLKYGGACVKGYPGRNCGAFG